MCCHVNIFTSKNKSDFNIFPSSMFAHGSRGNVGGSGEVFRIEQGCDVFVCSGRGSLECL